MDKNQRDAILEKCIQFEKIRIEDSIIEAYKDREDYSSISVDGQPLSFWIATIKKIVAQFKIEIQTDNYFFMPFTCSLLRGEADPLQCLNHIFDKISNKQQIDEPWLNQIYWCVEYQIRWGFWDKSIMKVHDVSAVDLKKKAEELALLEAQVEQLKRKQETTNAENEELKKKINSQLDEVIAFYNQKQSELKAIADALSAVSGQKAEVDNIHLAVISADNDIRTKFQNQEELLSQLKAQKEGQEKDWKNLLQVIEEEKTKLITTVGESDTKVKFFESLETFIKDKQAEIIELGALAAGAALGGTFGLRTTALNTGTNSWKKWIPLVTIGAMAWVVVVFTCFKGVAENIWVDTILKLAKTVPAFVLMGFVFKQYSKERNLEEEYAFKAAVANTIKAYADLLKGEDSDVNKSKQAMLLDAIRRVQSPPKMEREASGRMFSFSTRNLAKSIEQLNETVKNIKPNG